MIEVVTEEMHGSDWVLTWKRLRASLRLEKATPSTRAKWRSSLSACS